MTKQLKDQFTLRIYNQEDKELLDKTYSRYQSGFDTKTDFQRTCLILGAKKMLGDSEIDHAKYLSEINEKLENPMPAGGFMLRVIPKQKFHIALPAGEPYFTNRDIPDNNRFIPGADGQRQSGPGRSRGQEGLPTAVMDVCRR